MNCPLCGSELMRGKAVEHEFEEWECTVIHHYTFVYLFDYAETRSWARIGNASAIRWRVENDSIRGDISAEGTTICVDTADVRKFNEWISDNDMVKYLNTSHRLAHFK